MNSKQILCEHVNRLLRERNITKSELAEGIDMDKSNLGKMLNGQHPFDLNLLDPDEKPSINPRLYGAMGEALSPTSVRRRRRTDAVWVCI